MKELLCFLKPLTHDQKWLSLNDHLGGLNSSKVMGKNVQYD